MGRKCNDLTGQTFSNLIVLEKTVSDSNRNVRWKCKCICGNYSIVVATKLTRGVTQSCGCANMRTIKHGMHSSSEYQSWLGMKNRCLNKNEKSYKNYGGRGITIHNGWIDSFNTFFGDLGPKPSPDHSLERIDVNGNYEPLNCVWADKYQQARNRRINANNSSGVAGVYWRKGIKKWGVRIHCKSGPVNLGYYSDIEDAKRARLEGEKLYWGESS